MAATLVLPSAETLDALTGAEVHRLIFWLFAGYLVITSAAIGIVTGLLSHRIAGPEMVFNRAVKSMMHGDYAARVTLRKGDYLKKLSCLLAELQKHLRRRDEEHAALLQELGSALERGDVSSACDMIEHRLAAASSTAPTEPVTPSA
ncbi:MAG: hypothetical protein CMJ83_19600 [Planctomycetes bacterium]|jgi:hypothetical protein|nr:hypothetical protein [Planctomycetota bacterium]